MQLSKLKSKLKALGLVILIFITAFFWFAFFNSILSSDKNVEGVLIGFNCEINTKYKTKYDYDIFIEGGIHYSSRNIIACGSLDSAIIGEHISLIVRGNEFLSVSQNNRELLSYSSLSINNANGLAAIFIISLLLTMFSIREFQNFVRKND